MPFLNYNSTHELKHFLVDNVSVNYSYNANSYWFVNTPQKSTNAHQWLLFHKVLHLSFCKMALLWFSLFINSKYQFFIRMNSELWLKTKTKTHLFDASYSSETYLIDALYHGIQTWIFHTFIWSIRKNKQTNNLTLATKTIYFMKKTVQSKSKYRETVLTESID